MARQLKTSWVIIASSGATIDGRTIEKDCLTGMAKYYNPKLYSAKLWPDHYRFMPIGGSVLALKTEKATEAELKGEIHLMAILAPNDWLIEANRQGQYIHTSIEINDNFMNKGHCYLDALAVTDRPASVGTTELHFSQQSANSPTRCFVGKDINTCTALESKPGLVSRLFNTSLSDHSSPTADNEPMDKTQFEALQAQLTEHINAQFTALTASLGSGGSGDEPGGDSTPPSEPAAVTAEAFTALKNENADLKTRFEALETEFTALKNKPSGNEQEPPETKGDAEFTEAI